MKGKEDMWHIAVKASAMITSILVWKLSVDFSADAFAFQLPAYKWAGYALGFAVTVLELVFNEEGFDHGLTVAGFGLLSYFYDIVTNISGIWLAQGAKPIPMPNENTIGFLQVLGFPILLGSLLAWLPEPLMSWALVGSGYQDFLHHILNRADGFTQQRHSSAPRGPIVMRPMQHARPQQRPMGYKDGDED